MKITAIKQQVKDHARYSIFVDDKFSFGLSELGLINSGIKIGQEISEEDLVGYKDTSELDKLYVRVLNLLARRPRSEWEIRDNLKRKHVDPEKIDTILNMLSKRGYVDDKEFATRWVENRRLLKSISRRKLVVELKQKRISEDVISEVIAQDETDELEVLRDEIAKKRRQTRYQEDSKLIAYLARQGYNYGDIKQALEELSL